MFARRLTVGAVTGLLLAVSMAHAAALFPLSGIDGSNGIRLNAPGAFTAAAAGDVNGDGFPDLIVGAPRSNSGNGAAYVVFGKSTALPATLDLTTLNGSNGFRITGPAGGQTGISLASAGDFNGDGIGDLVIGAFNTANGGSSRGSVFVVFGRANFGSTLDLTALNGANGFRMDGSVDNTNLGYSVDGGRDLNGDGKPDIVIGSYPVAAPGVVYVLFGTNATFSATFNLATLNGSNGLRINGVANNDSLGSALSQLRDVNGDGRADLVIGSRNADRAYVVFGRSSFSSPFNLSAIDGSNGFKIDGAGSSDNTGYSVSGGDFNGDGLGDIVVGGDRSIATSGAAAYVVFGHASAFSASVGVSTLTGATGFRVDPAVVDDNSGQVVAGVGDANGDGIDDLVIGASGADNAGTNSGSTFMVFGRPTPFPATIGLATLSGVDGLRFDGFGAAQASGGGVAAAGDFNRDGVADFVVLAEGGNYAMVAYGNGAPKIVGGPATLGAFLEDAPSSYFVQLAVGSYYSDAQAIGGIAITSSPTVSPSGVWQYTLDFGANWLPVPSGLANSNALVLSSFDAIRFAPVADFNGVSPVLPVRLWDGADGYTHGGGRDISASIGSFGGFSAAELSVTQPVTAVNDPPSFAITTVPPASNEDVPQSVPNVAGNFSPGPANESAQVVLSYVVSNVTPGMFASGPSVAADGTLTYTPATNVSGLASFELRVRDNGGTSNGGNDLSPANTVQLTINAVNDAPTLTATSPGPVVNTSGTNTITGWASFSPGPADESAQSALQYQVSNIDFPALFAVAPAVAANGNLTFTPAPGFAGTSTFDVRVQDSGGTANGGIDFSAPKTFSITVITPGQDKVFSDSFD